MNRPLLVSNRLPVTAAIDDQGEITLQDSNGGLATGLKGPWKRTGAGWIGHAGIPLPADDPKANELRKALAESGLTPVEIADDVMRGFYAGISNGLLWPVFHDRVDLISFDPGDWQHYVTANEAFAEAVIKELRDDDIVWVHDYHLCLVPEMVRAARPDARIGFFLHVPFPAPETFSVIPWREEILRGILGADYIAFHTPGYLTSFLGAARRFGVGDVVLDGLRVGERHVRAGVLPMGIEAASWAREAREAQEQVSVLRQELGEQRLLLGVDRLDYSKGISRRLEAVDALLQKRPDFVGKIRFVQLGAPSREDVPAYADYRRACDELVGRINGKWGTGSWVPILNIERSLSQSEIVPFYRAADVMVVTPLKDGLNLVAKEFIATRDDDDGVLVLSEFAGASTEIAGAIEVNPFDIPGMAAALERALDMPGGERRSRMRTLRQRVLTWSAERWFEEFLNQVVEAATRRSAGSDAPVRLEGVLRELDAAARLRVVLDYDGTLVPLAPHPDQARPDAALLSLLAELAGTPGVSVHVVTGRGRESIEAFLGHLPITIHAEHGLWSRDAGRRFWYPNTTFDATWMDQLEPILQHFVAVTPGSWVEHKASSLAWHYRSAADPDHAMMRARELESLLGEAGAADGLHVLRGHCIIEIRPRHLHKGLIAQLVCRGLGDDELVFAAGDDRTDEDLFRHLPPESLTVRVGAEPTAARASVETHQEIRRVLHDIVKSRSRPAATVVFRR